MAEPAPSSEVITHDDLCPICHLLLYDPVKTQCNHVLCASCMAQWASISSMTPITPAILDIDDQDVDIFDEPVSDLEANCPMCRTSTRAAPHAELRRVLEEKYPTTYAERRAEEDASGSRIGQDGIEGITILVGNTHRLVSVEGTREGSRENKHDWTYFVRFSRPEIIQEVRVDLHPTFRPPRVVLTRPPFEVRRLGWGYFNIGATIVLKQDYIWVRDGSEVTTRLLKLEWMLDFDGTGKQWRVPAKVKRVEREYGRGMRSGREE